MIKAVCFDFMGTCLDWHSRVSAALPPTLDVDKRSEFALEWRQAYFDYNKLRVQAGQAVEDFDVTMLHVLESYLKTRPDVSHLFSSNELRQDLVKAWHKQAAWPDVIPAIQKLRDLNYEVYVHANGSTRLQMDLVKSSGLKFDMCFSSQLLGVYKPRPEAYRRVAELLKLQPAEIVMVAAHDPDDLKGAREAGIKTVYVHRWTDDVHENQDQIRQVNDAYLENMDRLSEVIGQFS